MVEQMREAWEIINHASFPGEGLAWGRSADEWLTRNRALSPGADANMTEGRP